MKVIMREMSKLFLTKNIVKKTNQPLRFVYIFKVSCLFTFWSAVCLQLQEEVDAGMDVDNQDQSFGLGHLNIESGKFT